MVDSVRSGLAKPDTGILEMVSHVKRCCKDFLVKGFSQTSPEMSSHVKKRRDVHLISKSEPWDWVHFYSLLRRRVIVVRAPWFFPAVFQLLVQNPWELGWQLSREHLGVS